MHGVRGIRSGEGAAVVESTERAMSKRYAGRREDLVEAAVDLFAANGYAGTSIRDIAKITGRKPLP